MQARTAISRLQFRNPPKRTRPKASTPSPTDSSRSESLALQIVLRLRSSGFLAYLVGGCVRDRLLGFAPKDYDVSTDATPAEILSIFPRAETVGAHFGVVLVTEGPGACVEVATFRSESTYADGRRPEVVHFEKEPEQDVRRRDFTINGLMEDPLTGQIVDYVGGQADLKSKVVRAIGDAETRFREDHLRMLRAVRFAARLGFDIEGETIRAIQACAHEIKRISAERIRDELVCILTQRGARRALELLSDCRLLRIILPEVAAFQGVPQPPEFHPEGDVWTHVLLMLEYLRAPTSTLALGVLLHDVGKPPTFRIADRIRFDGHAEVGASMTSKILSDLKFPREDIQHVTSLVANHMRFKDVFQMRLSTLKRFLRLPRFDEHLELHRLDCLASNGYTDSYEFVRKKLVEIGKDELRPKRLLTGKDLIRAGYAPGPMFGRALEAAETAQLDGEIATPEEALAVARSVLESITS